MTGRAHVLRLELEAHHPGRGHHRAYAVEVGQDLLFDWVVTVRFGRTQATGRTLAYRVPDLDAARRLVRGRLRRRLSAPRRIGCAYRLTYLTMAEGEPIEAWLPSGLLTAKPDDGFERGSERNLPRAHALAEALPGCTG